MSEWFAQISLDDIRNPDFGPSTTRVYCALKWHERNKGYAFPSIPRLAELTGLHERTVQRAIKKLVATGLIEKQSRTTRKGDPDTNLYTFPEAHEGVVASSPGVVATDATSLVATDAARVVAQRATTIRNRLLNRETKKDARAPDWRRSRFEPDPAANEALLAKCRMEGFIKDGFWLPDWGPPPLDNEDAVAIEVEEDVVDVDQAEPVPELRRGTGS